MIRKIVPVAIWGALNALLIGGVALPAAADKPKVYKARILKLHKTNYEIHVVAEHTDTGWDHRLDRWEVIGPGGKILGTRVFNHPHIGQILYTRSLRGVTIPEGITHLIIRTHDKVHGYSRERLIEMPTDKNPDTGFK